MFPILLLSQRNKRVFICFKYKHFAKKVQEWFVFVIWHEMCILSFASLLTINKKRTVLQNFMNSKTRCLSLLEECDITQHNIQCVSNLFTIDIRLQNKLLILFIFAACLSVFIISTINNQMHPE